MGLLKNGLSADCVCVCMLGCAYLSVCVCIISLCVLLLAATVRVERGHVQGDRAVLVVSTDVWGQAPDPQLRAVLQWMAASITELPVMQLNQQSVQGLQQVRFKTFLLPTCWVPWRKCGNWQTMIKKMTHVILYFKKLFYFITQSGV